MFKKSIAVTLFCIFSAFAFPQAGSYVYSFLDLPVSSRIAALGSSNVSLRDNDLSFALRNPALLTADNHEVISLSMANYIADIKFGSAMYGFKLKEKNFMAVGVQYIDYGKFTETNDLNETLGEFSAKDMAMYIVYARPLTNRITVGGTFKPISSFYERYTSYGVALDAGVSYAVPEKFFSAGLVIRNIGTQIKGYYANEEGQHYEPLPFDIQIGLTKKLEHAPFRFSLTLHNLQKWNLNYVTSNLLENTNTTISKIDMAFRHSIWAVEFVPGKNFYLAASYNHRRHNELKMDGFKSSTGFSFGGGLKLYKFQAGFGMSTFQTGNVAYQFSISTSLNQFRL